MRRIFGLIVAVTWVMVGFDAQAAEPDEPGWRANTVQPAQPSSRRQFASPMIDFLGGTRSRPVTLMQPYAGRVGYNCENDSLAAPARLPVPPPDILPISAIETIGDSGDAIQLAANEPARVILEIRDRVGTNLFAGTIFQDTGDEPNTSKQFAQPAKSEPADHLLVRCIRELEQRREQSASVTAECDGDCCCNGQSSTSASPEAVQALRLASRQLQEVAELLEEQNLYGRSDQLREMADALRQEARTATQAQSESRAD